MLVIDEQNTYKKDFQTHIRNKSFISYSCYLSNFDKHLLLQQYLTIQKKFNIKILSTLNFFIKIDNQILKKKKSLTILKAPFVHKKAREQFEIITYQLKINFCFLLESNFFKFFLFLSFIFKELKQFLKLLSISCKDFILNFFTKSIKKTYYDFFFKVKILNFLYLYNYTH